MTWEDAPQNLTQAVPVSYELEAVPLSSEGQIVKQVTKGQSRSFHLSKLLPGTRYQVSPAAGSNGHE